MIRILIADSNWLVRNGLRTFLERESNFEVLAEAANGHEAVELAYRLRPAIALMDLYLPALKSITATEIICSDIAETRVILLGSTLNGSLVFEAIKAGANGYVCKDADPGELCKAIETVAAGQVYLSHQAYKCLIHEVRSPQVLVRLTDREMDVLLLLVRGYSNKEIMLSLHISEDTVKCHVRHILSKLKVETRTQAVLAALRLGLVDRPFEGLRALQAQHSC
jgi:two-component system, NarL family, response regulator LiaR